MRALPRLPVEKLAREVCSDKKQLGLVVDLSTTGLRLETHSLARRESPILQLEFTIPEVDEIAWACGQVCFDRLHPNMVRTTGIRILTAANRHLRMLRDWVMSAIEASERDNPIMAASCWRG
jgi:hypothetical protein